MVPGETVAGEVEVTEIANLTNEQWAEYFERMTLYASNLFRARGWGIRDNFFGPGGITPGDIAAEAVEKVLDGKRTCDPDSCPNLLPFLCGVVRSLVSNYMNSADVQRTRPMPQVRRAGVGDPVDVEFEGREPTPLENCIRPDLVDAMKAIATEDGDELVMQIVECLDNDITKPAEIAEYLDVDIKDINNAQKRFRRKAEKLLERPRAEVRS